MGRGGLIYESAGESFFIDGEGLAGPESGIVVYANTIKRVSGPNRVGDLKKTEIDEILDRLYQLLREHKIYFEVIDSH